VVLGGFNNRSSFFLKYAGLVEKKRDVLYYFTWCLGLLLARLLSVEKFRMRHFWFVLGDLYHFFIGMLPRFWLSQDV
jgi:hypothetical protein